MKLAWLLTINGILDIALGIGFMVYAPVMLALFGIPEILEGNSLMYWNTASFARLFGGGLFALGFLVWAIRPLADGSQSSPDVHRGISFSLLLGNGALAIVALTQQASVWSVPAGWVLVGIFSLLTIGYLYVLAFHK